MIKRNLLQHPDLEIEMIVNATGEDMFVGRSSRYEPFEASAASAIECFFKFDIQLAEQKLLAAAMK